MTIKQYGGIFGRNPTFNNVTVDGVLTVDQIVEKTGAAGITLDGVTIKDGNVIVADGKGIDFSATSGTGTSELFDDYEEGTWTPRITFGGNATDQTYSTQAGNYTKVGNRVFCTAYIVLTSKGTDTGLVRIDGLPFVGSDEGPISIYAAVIANSGTIQGFGEYSSSRVRLMEINTGGSSTSLTDADFADTSSLRLAFNYAV